MRSSAARPPSTEESGPASEAPPVSGVSTEASGPTRRRLLHGGLAAGLVVAASGALGDAPASATPPTMSPLLRDASANPTGIHPFRVAVPREQLAALRRRVAATRRPSRELAGARAQARPR